MRAHTLTVLGGRVAICRRDPSDGMPEWFEPVPPLASLVQTEQELTIVLGEERVPSAEKADRGWRALRVEGPLELTSFGVIAGVTAPLATAEIGVFAISTYDTDYLLVQEADLERAVRALRDAGHEVNEAA